MKCFVCLFVQLFYFRSTYLQFACYIRTYLLLVFVNVCSCIHLLFFVRLALSAPSAHVDFRSWEIEVFPNFQKIAAGAVVSSNNNFYVARM
jgi:hypothetical protein